jgi:hypothetical protein
MRHLPAAAKGTEKMQKKPKQKIEQVEEWSRARSTTCDRSIDARIGWARQPPPPAASLRRPRSRGNSPRKRKRTRSDLRRWLRQKGRAF